MDLGRKNTRLGLSVFPRFAPRLLLFLLPVTTCCSPRWRTNKLSAAVAGTAILSYPFSFYRIIYHQRSRSLLHSAKRPGATALGRPVPRDLSPSRSRVSRRYEFLRFIAISPPPPSLCSISRRIPFPLVSLVGDEISLSAKERLE